ncbi:dipeptidase [Phaeovulum sp.]|uniref:dipeptidase n=1 Tax=Phaeovulum sp. TaxID=2934796 RepID=UPI003561AB15
MRIWGWLLGGAGVLLAAGAVGFFAVAPGITERALNRTLSFPWEVTPEGQAFHDGLTIGDWHSDTLLWDRDLRQRWDRGHMDLPRLREGNVAVQVFTTVTKSPRGLNYDANSADAPDDITLLMIGELRPIRTWFSLTERALDQAARLNAAAKAAPDELKVIRTGADLAQVLAAREAGSKIVGGILGAEGGHALEGDLANLDRLWDAGFRLMGLTHFFDNELGGSLHGEGGAAAGLSPFGYEVVAEMVARGMIIDLAHASPQMVRDVLAIEGTRPIVSHTGIRSHCETPRNIENDLLRAVVAKGGIVGIGFWDEATCDATPAGVAHAIFTAVEELGEDNVALGSDFDGAVRTGFDVSRLAVLTQALLDSGLNRRVIAKVMGGNMMRWLAENLPQ